MRGWLELLPLPRNRPQGRADGPQDVENAELALEHEKLDREIAEAKSKLSPGAIKLLDEFEESLARSPRSEIFTDEQLAAAKETS